MYKHTLLHWIYLWGGKVWTDSKMHTDSISSSLIYTNTHIHTKQRVKLSQVEPKQWDLLNISLCFYWPVRSVREAQCVCLYMCRFKFYTCVLRTCVFVLVYVCVCACGCHCCDWLSKPEITKSLWPAATVSSSGLSESSLRAGRAHDVLAGWHA